MPRTVLALAASCVVLTAMTAATFAGDRSGYYEWSTKRPFSGWVGPPPHSYYCDYIRYPVRRCSSRRVCKGGKCWHKESCRVVGWDIRQTCY
jgi:hypothetical protein